MRIDNMTIEQIEARLKSMDGWEYRKCLNKSYEKKLKELKELKKKKEEEEQDELETVAPLRSCFRLTYPNLPEVTEEYKNTPQYKQATFWADEAYQHATIAANRLTGQAADNMRANGITAYDYILSKTATDASGNPIANYQNIDNLELKKQTNEIREPFFKEFWENCYEIPSSWVLTSEMR